VHVHRGRGEHVVQRRRVAERTAALFHVRDELCAELLDVSITELEDAVCAALNQLPLLSSSTV